MAPVGNIPPELPVEFKGGSQMDWIIFDRETNRLFCIAIWTDPGKDEWVLGEYVNFFTPPLNSTEIDKMRDKGYMTMLEAALNRDHYEYVIGQHRIDVPSQVIADSYWQSLIPDLKADMTMSSPNTTIDLNEFLTAMRKLLQPGDVRWTNAAI